MAARPPSGRDTLRHDTQRLFWCILPRNGSQHLRAFTRLHLGMHVDFTGTSPRIVQQCVKWLSIKAHGSRSGGNNKPFYGFLLHLSSSFTFSFLFTLQMFSSFFSFFLYYLIHPCIHLVLSYARLSLAQWESKTPNRHFRQVASGRSTNRCVYIFKSVIQ